MLIRIYHTVLRGYSTHRELRIGRMPYFFAEEDIEWYAEDSGDFGRDRYATSWDAEYDRRKSFQVFQCVGQRVTRSPAIGKDEFLLHCFIDKG